MDSSALRALIDLDKPHEEFLGNSQVRVAIGLDTDDGRPLGLLDTLKRRLQILGSLHILAAAARSKLSPKSALSRARWGESR